MSKEIKEMAEEIYRAGVALDGSDFAYKSDHFERLAKVLYNAGYRKQEPIIIPTPIESGCAILCDTEKVAIKEFANKIIADLEKAKELNREKGKKAGGRSNLEMYNYCLGKIHACHGIIDLINNLKKEYGVE